MNAAHLNNEPDYINLLLGIQNVQMEMMFMLQTLQDNVSSLRRDISVMPVIPKVEVEDAVPCKSNLEKKPQHNIPENDGSGNTAIDNDSDSVNSYDDENVRFLLEISFV